MSILACVTSSCKGSRKKLRTRAKTTALIQGNTLSASFAVYGAARKSTA
jgi:hypothetical protein